MPLCSRPRMQVAASVSVTMTSTAVPSIRNGCTKVGFHRSTFLAVAFNSSRSLAAPQVVEGTNDVEDHDAPGAAPSDPPEPPPRTSYYSRSYHYEPASSPRSTSRNERAPSRRSSKRNTSPHVADAGHGEDSRIAALAWLAQAEDSEPSQPDAEQRAECRAESASTGPTRQFEDAARSHSCDGKPLLML